MSEHECTVALEWGHEEASFTGKFYTLKEFERLKKVDPQYYHNGDNFCEFQYCPFCGKHFNAQTP